MRLPVPLRPAARPTRFRRIAAAGLFGLVALSPAGAQAQNFFEELFGIGKAAKPPAPPRNVPVQPPAPVPGEPGAPALPGEGAETRPSAPPVPRQPVVLKVPAEDNVVGQDLLLNGLTGSLKIEKAGGAYTALMTLPGTKVSQPTETCSVKLNAGKPVTLTAEGRSQGVSRFSANAAECPLKLDVLDGSVLATPLGDKVCTFTAQDCATTPSGLWGPGAAALIPQAGEFDTARGVADRAVRDNFKLMTQRSRGQDVRPIVQEQAAFSSDREQACRTYAREGAHGYCHLRYTEARAIALATRLGANTASPTASNTPAPRPRRPKPAVDGVNPDAAGGGDPFAEQ
ncbi:hypothetical protein [Methylorubrum salsuginis]|uniref:Uncharacterized protein n=1 Tax=Methylorubrum salsuginis TaxID=414703 RepID=A0A1I4GX19_9HYPH|nr:hypothetical protein [Methylorubrum salsuginis]SFL34554.1 hypothetical protein SAMN04488125_11346 [Methylorubrum salsuginis]